MKQNVYTLQIYFLHLHPKTNYYYQHLFDKNAIKRRNNSLPKLVRDTLIKVASDDYNPNFLFFSPIANNKTNKTIVPHNNLKSMGFSCISLRFVLLRILTLDHHFIINILNNLTAMQYQMLILTFQ